LFSDLSSIGGLLLVTLIGLILPCIFACCGVNWVQAHNRLRRTTGSSDQSRHGDDSNRVTCGLITVSLMIGIGATLVASGVAYHASLAASQRFALYESVYRQIDAYRRTYANLYETQYQQLQIACTSPYNNVTAPLVLGYMGIGVDAWRITAYDAPGFWPGPFDTWADALRQPPFSISCSITDPSRGTVSQITVPYSLGIRGQSEPFPSETQFELRMVVAKIAADRDGVWSLNAAYGGIGVEPDAGRYYGCAPIKLHGVRIIILASMEIIPPSLLLSHSP